MSEDEPTEHEGREDSEEDAPKWDEDFNLLREVKGGLEDLKEALEERRDELIEKQKKQRGEK